jgi:hypothetical protein
MTTHTAINTAKEIFVATIFICTDACSAFDDLHDLRNRLSDEKYEAAHDILWESFCRSRALVIAAADAYASRLAGEAVMQVLRLEPTPAQTVPEAGPVASSMEPAGESSLPRIADVKTFHPALDAYTDAAQHFNTATDLPPAEHAAAQEAYHRTAKALETVIDAHVAAAVSAALTRHSEP